MQQKIVITGAPGTGKSTILNELIIRGYTCMKEISREIINNGKENGIDQLFLADPLLFSKLILSARKNQFEEAAKMNSEIVFFDRAIPDITGYMDYLGVQYPADYIKSNLNNRYSRIFLFPPWKKIYSSDTERYENFEQAIAIHKHLFKTYSELGYNILEVPKNTVKKRVTFILNAIY